MEIETRSWGSLPGAKSDSLLGVMDQRQVIQVLQRYGLDDSQVASARLHLPTDAIGVLIYGSRARGDALPESDFDLLVLVDRPRPTVRDGLISVSYYTADQLLSASGTLYGTHLIRDAKIVCDDDGKLESILDRLVPADPAVLLERVAELSVVLDVPAAERAANLGGLTRLARYLLRTAIYARAMESGRPCFSVRELADRFQDPSLERLLASDPSVVGDPTVEQLDNLCQRLEGVIGTLAKSELNSLESLAVSHWDSDRTLAAVAIRAINAEDDAFDYTDLPKVVL